MSNEPKFKVGNCIWWDGYRWTVTNIDNQYSLYTLALAANGGYTIKHGSGGISHNIY